MIALDSNVIIYAMEGHPIFGPAAATLLRQRRDQCAASVLTYAEVLAGRGFIDESLRQEAIAYLDELPVEYVELNKAVLIMAADMRARFPVKVGLADAIHLASAVRSGATHFVTNDKALLGLQPTDCTIISLSEAAQVLA